MLNMTSIDLSKYKSFIRHPNYYKKNITFFLTSRRMSEVSIDFDDKRINKNNIYKNKKLFKTEDIEVNKILVSNKESHGTKNSLKYFIGYNDDVIRPLCIKLPQMIGYVKCFDSNKAIF